MCDRLEKLAAVAGEVSAFASWLHSGVCQSVHVAVGHFELLRRCCVHLGCQSCRLCVRLLLVVGVVGTCVVACVVPPGD